MRWILSLTLGLAGLAAAAPPEVPAEVKLSGSGLGRIEISVPEGVEIGVCPAFSESELFFEELSQRKGKRRFLLQAQPDAKGVIPSGRYTITWWTKGEVEGVYTRVVVSGVEPAPAPKPKPNPDDPPGPKPDPKPAGKFRVLLVYENQQVLDQKQFSALYGKEVELYLDGRCGKGNWGRQDKDREPYKGYEAMVTASVGKATPLVVAEADGLVTARPMPATVADTLKLLKELSGDK